MSRLRVEKFAKSVVLVIGMVAAGVDHQQAVAQQQPLPVVVEQIAALSGSSA